MCFILHLTWSNQIHLVLFFFSYLFFQFGFIGASHSVSVCNVMSVCMWFFFLFDLNSISKLSISLVFRWFISIIFIHGCWRSCSFLLRCTRSKLSGHFIENNFVSIAVNIINCCGTYTCSRRHKCISSKCFFSLQNLFSFNEWRYHPIMEPEVHRNVMVTMTHNFNKKHVINQQLVWNECSIVRGLARICCDMLFFLMIHFRKYL